MFVSGRKWKSGINGGPLPSPAILWIVSVCERKYWEKKEISFFTSRWKHRLQVVGYTSQVSYWLLNRLIDGAYICVANVIKVAIVTCSNLLKGINVTTVSYPKLVKWLKNDFLKISKNDLRFFYLSSKMLKINSTNIEWRDHVMATQKYALRSKTIPGSWKSFKN